MDMISALRTFARVVEAGGFTIVADELGTTQPTVSRQIAALEQHLGARLLSRSTRSVAPTDDGRSFYEHALRVLEAMSEAECAVGRHRAEPSGTLRLAAPVVLGRLHIIPRLPAFMARHPEVRVDLTMSDGFTDLVELGIDLAVRVGLITDQALVARRIGIVRRLTVASPAYLAARGRPRDPHDLADHDCIVYSRLATGNRWHFEGRDGPITVDVNGRYRVDNSEAVREGVLAGLGIAVIPAFAFSNEVGNGRVKVLLGDYEPTALPMNAVYPSRRFVPPRVRAMIDFLVHEFAIDPVLNDGGFAGT